MRYRFTLKKDLPATASPPPVDMQIVVAQCTSAETVYESDIRPDPEIIVWIIDSKEDGLPK